MHTDLSSMNNKISLGLNSNDIGVLKQLSDDMCFKVRRAVAKNRSTPSDILNILAYDPVANVSFTAVNHENCEVQRCFEDCEHPCICCNVHELKMDCGNCKRIKDFCSA